MPGGGISLARGAEGESPTGTDKSSERWVSCRPRFFLPVRVLSSLFCRLFLEKLVAAHEAGRLLFFGDHAHLADGQACALFLDPLRDIDWVVYAKPPFAGPEAVLAYLSRYTHRIRHYGLFANGGRTENLARARRLLCVPTPRRELDPVADAEEPPMLSYPCPSCGGPMIVIETFEPGYTPWRHAPRAPPPSKAERP